MGIKGFRPTVLGAQEVETGGGNGGSYVSEKVTSGTGLSGGVGLNQFYDKTVVEALDHEFIIPLVRGYWMSMTRFRHKATNIEFLFFNSHWKHGYGPEQGKIIANAIHAERQKYSSPPPTIFVGDTNQFCMAAELEAIKYLKGEEGDSPVTFVDAHAHDKGAHTMVAAGSTSSWRAEGSGFAWILSLTAMGWVSAARLATTQP